jgi:hypothetical protein
MHVINHINRVLMLDFIDFVRNKVYYTHLVAFSSG